MRVFVTKIIPAPGLELLKQAGLTISQWTEERPMTKEELLAGALQCDALFCSGPYKLDKAFLQACSHLRVIALMSVGFDQVDVAEATRLGIPVGNTPGVLSNATADMALLLMLATSRKAFYMYRKIVNGTWTRDVNSSEMGMELQGKTLGIVGLGKIGLEMARKCRALYNMHILYHNRGRNEQAEKTLGAERVSFEELLRRSDVVSVHVALTPDTRNLFDRRAFAQMKPTAIFINTSRGGVHNEADLTAAIRDKTIWGAGLDVTNPEPMHKDNPLLTMPSVCVLPHIGSATLETRTAMAELAAKNILAGLAGQPLPAPVNPAVTPAGR